MLLRCTLRYIFAAWNLDDSKPARRNARVWKTDYVEEVSKAVSLQNLRSGVVGWGGCRLLNVSAKKPAESAAIALPPAVAILRTRPEGDMTLTLSFHIAVLHQVCLH